MLNELIKRVLSSIILLPILVFVIINGSFYFFLFILVTFLITIYEWKKMKIINYLKTLGIIFLIFSFFTFYEIRTGFSNYLPFLIIILICILTDTGGYIFGKIFKGPKLTKLSPKKTYAGVFGAYFFCLILYFVILKNNLIASEYMANFLLFLFLVSSISQLGDILVSYFKRLSNIKDTGKNYPRSGGLLDRIDGMIFAFPASYLFLMFEYFSFFT